MVLDARMTAAMDRAAADAGTLPLAWFEVLVALDTTPGHRVRLRDLAEAVLLTRAGLSRLVDRIEAAGYLRRERCERDRRGSFAVLTAAGAAALAAALPTHWRTIDDRFARHLSPDQVKAITAALRGVLAANDWLPELRPVPLTVRRKPPDPTPD